LYENEAEAEAGSYNFGLDATLTSRA